MAYVESIASLLTEGEYAVAAALALVAREDDDAATITIAKIGQLAGRKDRRTRQLIHALEDYGLLLTDHQFHGVRHPRTTYRFVELEESRPRPKPDTATVINLAKALQRKAEAQRARMKKLEERLKNPYQPILLATIYEEMERARRDEADIQEAEGRGSA